MTVIATVISQYCVAHATDSMLSEQTISRTYRASAWKTTKIVCVPRWSGIVSYFGLASYDRSWSTLEWLRHKARLASDFSDPESFANEIASDLTSQLSRMKFSDQLQKGMGIHFTVYENVDEDIIPELFAITNFANTDYNELHADGLHATRETYISMRDMMNNILKDESPFKGDTSQRSRHAEPDFRRHVKNFLKNGGLLLYNNGDPRMFNPAANAIFSMIQTASIRNTLGISNDPRAYRRIVQFPIDLVSNFQREFFKKGYQVVGGKPHNLSVTPRGTYDSDTGDKCIL